MKYDGISPLKKYKTLFRLDFPVGNLDQPSTLPTLKMTKTAESDKIQQTRLVFGFRRQREALGGDLNNSSKLGPLSISMWTFF